MLPEIDMLFLKYRFAEGFGNVAALIGDPSRTGAYAAIANKFGIVIACFVIGNPNPEKAPKYYRCAGEKCFRLGQNPNHLTSAESANENQEKYPGAWRTAEIAQPNSYIISVSGLPTGEADTAVGLYAMCKLRETPLSWAGHIADLDNQNGYFEQLKPELALTLAQI